jgi:hypothetical protein
MISIQPGQSWNSVDGSDPIAISHSEGSRWVVSTSSDDTVAMTASDIRSRYRFADDSIRDESTNDEA